MRTFVRDPIGKKPLHCALSLVALSLCMSSTASAATYTATDQTSFNAAISSSQSSTENNTINVNATGPVNLSAATSFSGNPPYTLNVNILNAAPFTVAAPLVVNPSGTVNLTPASPAGVQMQIASSLTQNGGTVSATNHSPILIGSTGTYSLNSGVLLVGGTSGISSLGGNLVFGGPAGVLQVIESDLTFNVPISFSNSSVGVLNTNGFNATYSGVLSSQPAPNLASLIKAGTGTLTFSGYTATGNCEQIIYAGNLEIQGKTTIPYLAVGSGSGGSATLTLTDPNLNLVIAQSLGKSAQSPALQVGDFSGVCVATQTGGTVTIRSGSFNISNQGGVGTYNLDGGTVLVQQGSLANIGRNTLRNAGTTGTLNLSGQGILEVSGTGTSLIVGSRAAATSPTARSTGHLVQTGGTLRVLHPAVLYLGSFGKGTYDFTGGVLELEGSALQPNYSGGIAGYTFNIDGSPTLRARGTGFSTNVNLSLSPQANPLFDTNGATATWSGVISGTGGLTKTNLGTLILSGTNTKGGTTTISGGVLRVSADAALGTASAPLVLAGGVLQYGASFSLNGARTITTSSPQSGIDTNGLVITLANPISGTGGIIKSGTGTLILSGANTYSGPSLVNTGTLKTAGAAPALSPSSAMNLASGVVLDVSSSSQTIASLSGSGNVSLGSSTLTLGGDHSNTTYAGVISGAGSIRKTGAGTFTLLGANTYLGGTILSQGAIDLGANATLGASALTCQNVATLALEAGASASNPINLSGANTINVSSGTGTLSGVISGTGSLTKQGSGALILSGSNTYGGTTTIGGGVLRVSADTALGTASAPLVLAGGVLHYGASFSLNGARTITTSSPQSGIDTNGLVITLANPISGTGGIIKSGTGTLILSGANTYSGPSLVNTGTLKTAGAAPALSPSSAMNLASGVVLDVSSSSQTVASLSGSGNVSLGSSTLTLGGDHSNTTYAGVISGAGSITKTGAGTFTLLGANTYLGGTILSQGAIDLGANATLGASALACQNAATLVLEAGASASNPILLSGANTINVSSGTGALSGVISGTGSLTKGGSGTLILSGSNTYEGTTTIDAGTLRVSADVALGTASAPLTLAGGVLQYGASFSLSAARTITTSSPQSGIDTNGLVITLANPISGTGGLIKSGTGALFLSGPNTYRGNTTIAQGTLGLSGPAASLMNSSAVVVDGTLDLNATEDTVAINTLSGTGSDGSILLGAYALTITQSATGTYPGTISGVGTLIKGGSSTLILSGTGTYSGGTQLVGGALMLGSTGALPAGGAIAVDIGTLDLNGYSLSLGNFSGETSGFTQLGNGSLSINQSIPGTYAGAILGTGGLIKSGPSTLVLSGSNTYAGHTTIAQGTLGVSGPMASLRNSSAVEVAGILDLSNAGATALINNLSGTDLNGSILLGPHTLDINQSTTGTYSGTISGAGGLIKRGAATLILSGTGTYSGGTQLVEGSLTLGSTGALPVESAFAVDAGTLNLNGYPLSISHFSGGTSGVIQLGAGALSINASSDATYPGTFSGQGTVTKQGAATLQLTGDSSLFQGTCIVQVGELKLNGTLGSTASGNVHVNTAALLTGNAIIGGNLTSNGIVSPGNSVGTLNVGSLTLLGDSLLDVDITSNLQSDIITVSPLGTAHVDGTLNINFLPGVYVQGMAYTIINSPGGVNGTFKTTTDNSAIFNIAVSYSPSQVVLTILQPGEIVFYGLDLKGNARIVADNLAALSQEQTLLTDPDLYKATLAFIGQEIDFISDSLKQLDPTLYTAIGAASALVSPMLAEFYGGRTITNCLNDPSLKEGWQLWANPFALWARQSQMGSQDRFDTHAQGLAIGAEKKIRDAWRWGLGVAYDHLSTDWSGGRSHSSSDNAYLASFANVEGSRGYLGLTLMGGFDRISNVRKIHYATVNNTAHSHYWGYELIGQMRVGARLGPENQTIQYQLYGAVTSDTLFQPEIREKQAGGLNLSIRPLVSSVLLSEAGLSLNITRSFSKGCWEPKLWAGYMNETFLTQGKVTSSFTGQSIPFTTRGISKSQNLCELGAAFALKLNSGFSCTGTYSPQIGTHLVTHRADIKLEWKF
jgi:fibronectin-binding autotransporter adhesin